MMNKLADKNKRAEIMATWAPRLEKLATRKENPKDNKQFSAEYGFCRHWICKAKNGYFVSGWKKINEVQDALSKEGV